MQIIDLGMSITGFQIMSFNYPKEIQDKITKTASHGMIGDLNRYQQVEMTDGIASGKVKGGGAASDMAGMMMGMNVANEMMKNMNQSAPSKDQNENEEANATSTSSSTGKKPNFCPNCGEKNSGANFCPNCGEKLG